jgi:hypothetical protein
MISALQCARSETAQAMPGVPTDTLAAAHSRQTDQRQQRRPSSTLVASPAGPSQSECTPRLKAHSSEGTPRLKAPPV